MTSEAAIDALSRFAAPNGNLVHLGGHGGFSGARLWRLEGAAGAFALKAWPADWRSAADLAWIHGLLRRAAPLPWLPRLVPTQDGASFVRLQGQLWELATWMPGHADFTAAPSTARLQAAATALAQLHQIWKGDLATAICPAVLRRLDAWKTWIHLVQSGWRPRFTPLDSFRVHAEDLWRIVIEKIDEVPRLLTPWLHRRVVVQPCVCDLWHDHVLFTGDAVTGIIDFGSAKIDHVAVDLARLFGSLIGEDDVLWTVGLSSYEQICPLSAVERELARTLDRTGVIIAATQWLRWLYHEGRVYDNVAAVTARLEALLTRLSG